MDDASSSRSDSAVEVQMPNPETAGAAEDNRSTHSAASEAIEKPEPILPTFRTLEWFTTHNIMTLEELDRLPSKISRNVSLDSDGETATKASSQCPSGDTPCPGPTEYEAKDDIEQAKETAAPKGLPMNGDGVDQLQDTLAAAFVRGKDGKLLLRKAGIMIWYPEHGPRAVFDPVLIEAARSARASIISISLEDFEDLAADFYEQERHMGPEVMRWKDGPHDPTAFEGEDQSISRIASYYFAANCARCDSQNSPDLCMCALSALLDAQHHGKDVAEESTKDNVEKAFGDDVEGNQIGVKKSLINTQSQPRTVIHVRNVNTLENAERGFCFLHRLQDFVQDRRRDGQDIALIATVFSDEDLSDSCSDLSFVSQLDDNFFMPITIKLLSASPEHADGSHTSLASINIRRLKRLLRREILDAFSPDVLEPWTEWSQYSGKKSQCIGEMLWSKQDLNRAVIQIIGKTLEKTELSLDDVQMVLRRRGLDTSSIMEKTAEEPVKDPENDTLNDAKMTWEEKVDKVKQDCTDEYEEALLDCIVNPDKVKGSYDDVILSDDTKDNLKFLINLSSSPRGKSPSILLEQIQVRGALLYGPPGTGKTHLTRAIAKESDACMLTIDAAATQTKYVGDTEKTIHAAFSLATKLHPCILFIDEVDALFYRRSSEDCSWQRSALTQFFVEMDGLIKDDKAPFLIVATNHPGDLDEAFLRRLPRKFHLGLPDTKARRQILDLLLKGSDLDPLVNVDDLASLTEGYSGSDLRSLCSSAAMAWAMEQVKMKSGQKYLKTFGLQEMDPFCLGVTHVAKALQAVRPSVSRVAIDALEDFMEKFNPNL